MMPNNENRKLRIKMLKISNAKALDKMEKQYKKPEDATELLPWANGTSYLEIAEHVIRDHEGAWKTPLFLIQCKHSTMLGMTRLCQDANTYLLEMKNKKKNVDFDILSISARMDKSQILLHVLVRSYNGPIDFVGFYDYVNDDPYEYKEEEIKNTSGTLIIPDNIKNFHYTEEEVRQHDMDFNKQSILLNKTDPEHPFLNGIDEYIPQHMPTPADNTDLIYDLRTSDMKTKTISPYEQYIKVFNDVMSYVNNVEYHHYRKVINNDGETEQEFLDFIEEYINREHVKTGRLPLEDVPVLLKKLHRSLFQLYVVQDLIDDPNVTDIKITAPDAIRARIHGKAYMSNISFIDRKDYLRFIDMIALRNRIALNVPSQTFTDNRDENYVLRFSITAEYVNSVDWPYLHIRKIARKKMLGDDLIKAGMFDEKIRDYLLDCGKTSRGVVFAGPPGSGKTVALNWFLEEAYEQSAEILVIQENDELFCYRKGVMFQHVVNYSANDEQPVNLEQLGQLALVAGANVFIIGEAKGAEICSAITLSNSGCRTAITIHSPSSTETIDKMADLAMRGYANDYDQAKRMLKSFQTIVYLENFSVREISEITGYDDEKHEMTYRYIYRKPGVKGR